MKRIFFVLVAAGMINTGVMNSNVRTDARTNMPRGLTVDKSPMASPKKRDERPRNLKHRRKGLQGYKKRYVSHVSDIQG